MRLTRSKLLYAAGTVLGGVMLILALRGVKWPEVGGGFRNAHLSYLLAALGPSIAALWLRAMRWRVLLQAERTVPRATVFWANAIGYFGNYVLPARGGDLVRIGVIRLKTGLPLAFVLATAAIERLVDAAVLVAIVSAGVAGWNRLPAWMAPALTGMAVAAAAGLAVLFAISRIRRLPEGLYRALRLSPAARGRVSSIFSDLSLGLRALQKFRRASAFFALTAIIWCCDAAGTMLGARAFDIALPFAGAIVFVGALGLSSAIPSAPGYVGMYQFVAVTVLPLYGAPKAVALAFSLVSHAFNYFLVVTCGLTGLMRLRLGIGDARTAVERRGATAVVSSP